MITRFEFDNADNVDRLAMIFDAGTEVVTRIFAYYSIKLYVLKDFYVEVWYRQSLNSIDKIQRVELNDVFHLYEKSIDISDLYN